MGAGRAAAPPHTVTLNGEDQDAYIADANLERRDLTKGQKAMLLAIPFPKGPRGRGKVDPARAKGEETSSFRRVQQGRMVNELCPEMVKQIIDGAVGLDEAYNEATKRLGMRESKRTPDEPWRWTIPSAGAALTKTRRKLDSVG